LGWFLSIGIYQQKDMKYLTRKADQKPALTDSEAIA
jgi:hypothetical protein